MLDLKARAKAAGLKNQASALLRAVTISESTREMAWMLLVTVVGNLIASVYSLAVARLLGPEAFGELATLLAVYLLGVPLVDALGIVTARRAAVIDTHGDHSQLSGLARGGLRKCLLLGMLTAGLFAALSIPLAAFLRTSGVAIILVGLCFVPLMLLATSNGVLRGMVRFRTYGLALLAKEITRLALSVIAVAAGFGVYGILVGTLAALSVSLALGLFSLKDVLRAPETPVHAQAELARPLAADTVLGTASLAALVNLPMPLVSHLFDPLTTGQFASAVTLGKLVYFVPSAVALVLLPRVARRHAQGESVLGALRRGQAVVAALAGCLVLGVFLFPKAVVIAGFGEQFLAAASIAPLYALASAGYALTDVWMVFFLAIGRAVLSRVLAVVTLVEMAAIWLWHPDLTSVVGLVLGSAVLLVVLCEAYLVCLLRSGGLASAKARIAVETS